jgi:hypothetical protein
MSEKGMQINAKKQLLPDFKGASLKPCDHCLFGKQHRVSFARCTTRKSRELLELVDQRKAWEKRTDSAYQSHLARKTRHLLALWFGIDSLSMAHPFFEPCQ